MRALVRLDSVENVGGPGVVLEVWEAGTSTGRQERAKHRDIPQTQLRVWEVPDTTRVGTRVSLPAPDPDMYPEGHTEESIRTLFRIGAELEQLDKALQEYWPTLEQVLHPDINKSLRNAMDRCENIDRIIIAACGGAEAFNALDRAIK